MYTYIKGESYSREGNCTGCGEPFSKVGVSVGNVCYDCADLCRACRIEPADPETGVCPDCMSDRPDILTEIIDADTYMTKETADNVDWEGLWAEMAP